MVSLSKSTATRRTVAAATSSATARDADLGAHGIEVRRFTWHQITRRGLWLAARLEAAISARA
jgi:hypothetical protein